MASKRWLDSRGLKKAPVKTEALLVTERRSFQYPRIVLGEHEIEWKKSIKYLGVQLDGRLSFGEHLQIANAKTIQCGATLTRLVTKLHKCPVGTQPCDRNSGERGPECFAVACRRRFLLFPRYRDGDGQRCRASYVFKRHGSIIFMKCLGL